MLTRSRVYKYHETCTDTVHSHSQTYKHLDQFSNLIKTCLFARCCFCQGNNHCVTIVHLTTHIATRTHCIPRNTMNTTAATYTSLDPSFSEVYDMIKTDMLLLGQEMHDGSAAFHVWFGMLSLLCVCMCYVTAVAQALLFVEGKIGIVGGLYTILDSAGNWVEYDLPCLLHNGLRNLYAMPITIPLAVVWIIWQIGAYLIVSMANSIKKCLCAVWNDITQPIQDPTTRGLWMLPYNTVCVLYTIIACTVLSLVWCVQQVYWIVTGFVCGVVHVAVFVVCFVGGSLWYLFVTLPRAMYAWSMYYPRILSVACVELYKWGWNDLEIFVQETYDMVFDWYDD